MVEPVLRILPHWAGGPSPKDSLCNSRANPTESLPWSGAWEDWNSYRHLGEESCPAPAAMGLRINRREEQLTRLREPYARPGSRNETAGFGPVVFGTWYGDHHKYWVRPHGRTSCPKESPPGAQQYLAGQPVAPGHPHPWGSDQDRAGLVGGGHDGPHAAVTWMTVMGGCSTQWRSAAAGPAFACWKTAVNNAFGPRSSVSKPARPVPYWART